MLGEEWKGGKRIEKFEEWKKRRKRTRGRLEEWRLAYLSRTFEGKKEFGRWCLSVCLLVRFLPQSRPIDRPRFTGKKKLEPGPCGR